MISVAFWSSVNMPNPTLQKRIPHSYNPLDTSHHCTYPKLSNLEPDTKPLKGQITVIPVNNSITAYIWWLSFITGQYLNSHSFKDITGVHFILHVLIALLLLSNCITVTFWPGFAITSSQHKVVISWITDVSRPLKSNTHTNWAIDM